MIGHFIRYGEELHHTIIERTVEERKSDQEIHTTHK